ncbi:hypothetical protein GCM10025864_12100 [Luteimicrobium album]|uniref:Uncharacterized protein n=1 Tax=Luteimicrobium album TaxID=1054550 RepID=A0ABQ6HYB8_9MICO|nr:hypothetical protein GCM10025864_12100 [Luteimicrobium album]
MRTIEPNEPAPPPARIANRYSSGSGARVTAVTISPISPTLATASMGSMMRRCPWRSTSRASWGEHTACAMTSTAEIRPASAYDPYSPWIIRTVPIPTIDMGSRATRADAENCSAPGTRRIAA